MSSSIRNFQNVFAIQDSYSTLVKSHPLTLALAGMPIPTAAVAPASTGNIAPVIHLAWLLARKTTAQAASHPVPSVPSKLRAFLASLVSSDMPLAYIIGVYSIWTQSAELAKDYSLLTPGQTQLTRMPSLAW